MVKVTIPVVVCRSGAILTGYFQRKSNGETEGTAEYALDSMDDADFNSGYVVVNIEAEVDIDAVLKQLTVKGEVA